MLRLTSCLVIVGLIIWFLWSEYDLRKEIRTFCKNEYEKRLNK